MLLGTDAFRRLCEARDLLREPGDPPLPVREVARRARMSHFHFIRRFHALFGLTPHQYRIRSRLERARILLATGGHSVTDVCMDVGCSSLGSFSDQFTRRTGAAPARFQRTARALAPSPGALPPPLFPGCLSLMTALPAHAFRNFREANDARSPIESEVPYANQTDQPAGG